MSDENDELNAILEADEEGSGEFEDSKSFAKEAIEEAAEELKSNPRVFTHCQFSQLMDNQFTPCGPTVVGLPPGVYKAHKVHSVGLVYTKVPVKVEELIKFPDSTSEKVITEIRDFWDRKDLFKKFSFPHKRGILLWGPPGSGKSSTIQLIIKDVIDRKGCVLLFDNPSTFIEGYNTFRKIQPETPVVVIMEDLDEIIHRWGENEVLQILDGVHRIHKTCFLATTNYPQRLKARVVNRPSRFDKRFKIDFPNEECRRVYIENIKESQDIDVDKWVEDTDEFSFAHLKELFIATQILGNEYQEALDTLKSMRQRVATNEDEEFEKNKVGFGIGGALAGSKRRR
jgi:energy-coupling factor transporter ATP-binding protein EcfA2